MKRFFFCSTIFFFCFGSIIFAQTDTSKSVKVVVFDQQKYFENSKKKNNPIKNVLKIDPLLLIRGELPIFYERALSSKASIELGIGITFSDYIGNAISLAKDEGSNEHMVSSTGNSFRGMIRYYPDGVLDENYFGIGACMRIYNSEYHNVDSLGNELSSTIPNQKKLTDFMIYYGKQGAAWDSDFVLYDIYFGLGIRMTNSEVVTYEYLQDPISFTSYYQMKVEKINKMLPTISFGIRIGLGF